MSHFKTILIKLLKFLGVGFSGLLIDFGITWLIKDRLKGNKYLASSLGFCLAVLNNFYWNRVWTFQSHSQWQGELGLFIVFALIGLLINILVLYFFHEKMNLSFYPSKILATLLVFFWNFFSNFFFNFQ